METEAEDKRPARLFGLPAAMTAVMARFRAAFMHSSSGAENDVEDRIRNVELELEQARRLDGIAPPRPREQ